MQDAVSKLTEVCPLQALVSTAAAVVKLTSSAKQGAFMKKLFIIVRMIRDRITNASSSAS
jgi:hypothetical protein